MINKLFSVMCISLISLFIAGCSFCGCYQKTHIIKTYPENGAVKIKPGVTKIVFTFNRNISENWWSISMPEGYTTSDDISDFGKFAELKGNSLIDEVKLEANTNYTFIVGSSKSSPFLDENGETIKEYILKFSTGE